MCNHEDVKSCKNKIVGETKFQTMSENANIEINSPKSCGSIQEVGAYRKC